MDIKLSNIADGVAKAAKYAPVVLAPLMVKKLPRSASVAVLASLSVPTGVATFVKVLPLVATGISKLVAVAENINVAEEEVTPNSDT